MRWLPLFVCAAVLSAAQTPKPKPGVSSTHRTAASATTPKQQAVQNTPTLNTEDDKTIYALGLSVYRSLGQFDLSPQEIAIIQQALTDAAAKKPAVDINVYGPKIQALAQARMARGAEQQKAESKAFLDKAAAESGAVKTPSGLVYRDLRPGTGASPVSTDTVRVNYRGTLVDGTEFDSSYARNEPAEFALNRVIPCWTEGLQKMKVGGKAQLVCPSDLAYGDSGNQGIPGGATLVFEVELLGINGSK